MTHELRTTDSSPDALAPAAAHADEVLSREFLARLRSYILKRVPAADADDVLQDVLLKLVQHGGAVQAGSLAAWMFTVARRTIIDRYRKPTMQHLEEAVAEPSSNAVERSAMQELAACMQPLMQGLNAADQHVLQRVDLEGESQAAMAVELGLPVSTVKSRVQRARRRLMARLSACCTIQRDMRGVAREYQQNAGSPCNCAADGCA